MNNICIIGARGSGYEVMSDIINSRFNILTIPLSYKNFNKVYEESENDTFILLKPSLEYVLNNLQSDGMLIEYALKILEDDICYYAKFNIKSKATYTIINTQDMEFDKLINQIYNYIKEVF